MHSEAPLQGASQREGDQRHNDDRQQGVADENGEVDGSYRSHAREAHRANVGVIVEVRGEKQGGAGHGPEHAVAVGVPAARAKHIVDYHTTPEQAGEVFARVKPKLAVYSHICMPSATEQDLIPATRKAYAGPLELGEDLMVIDVGESIGVRKYSRASP